MKNARRSLPYLVAGDHHRYDGSDPWWTLRFQGQAPVEPYRLAALERLGLLWAKKVTVSHVRASELRKGDVVRSEDGLECRVDGFTERQIGAKTLRLLALSQEGPRGLRLLPEEQAVAMTFERIESIDPRHVFLEPDVEPWFETQDGWEAFYAGVDAYLERLHRAHPLVAVFFQEGQFFDGERLLELSDDELRTRVMSAPSGDPA